MTEIRRCPLLLRLVLSLAPTAFRERFAGRIAADLEALRAEDPRAAPRFLLDLTLSLPGIWLDARRLARLRRARPTPRPLEASMLDLFFRDLRMGWRRLLRSPVITFVAVLTLSLGIGGSTAIFSLVREVLLQPLSAPAAERLVHVHGVAERNGDLTLTYEGFRDFESEMQSLDALAVVRPQSVAVTGGELPPERIRGLFVSSSFFDVLAEEPVLGRRLLPGEDMPGGERAAVLSWGFWQRRFGGDEQALGQVVRLNDRDHVIVGVMGEDFRFPIDRTEAWISLQTYPGELNRSNRTLWAIGRLAPDSSLEEARAELELVAASLAAEHPTTHGDISASATPLLELFTAGRSRELLSILVLAVAMVLLIGGANVANLQLARATGRRREMAIRTAIGARRRMLLRQLLIENLLLAFFGGLAGLAVAFWAIRGLSTVGPSWLDLFTVEPDPGLLLFALVLSLGSGILFGLVPARSSSRVDLVDALREGSRGETHGRAGGRLRAGIVVVQVALAVTLVVGAGLVVRSFTELQSVEPGFDVDGLLTVQFRLPDTKYAEAAETVAFFDSMRSELEGLAGVEGVASALGMPFTGDEPRQPLLADGVDPGAEVEVPALRTNVVSPGYFETMGIPVLSGRTFEPADRADTAPVAVLSAGAATRLWPDEDEVLGRTLRIRGQEPSFTVIGIVGDIHNRGLRDGIDPMVYASYRQNPERFATVAVRFGSDELASAPGSRAAVREAIWSLDPDQPLWEVMTQRERIAGWIGSELFASQLLGLFALLAVLLAAIGIAGVLAYSVSLRQREMGIRLSLGSSRSGLIALVLGQGLRLVLFGVGLGLLGALALGRSLGSLLFGIGPADPVSFLAAPVVLIVVALLSTAIPAWRASRVDPVRALRAD